MTLRRAGKPDRVGEEWLDRARGRILSARRALIALGVGVIVGGLVAVFGVLELFPLVSWGVAATVVLIGVWRISLPQDDKGTKRLAEEESQSRSTDTGVLGAAVASLGAVALALIRSSSNQDPVAVVLVILSVVAAVLAWALGNTGFALKYARLYYVDEDGGIDFNQQEPPAYSDFAYMAFTIGMTYAMQTEPANAQIRKLYSGTHCCPTSSPPASSPWPSTWSPISASPDCADHAHVVRCSWTRRIAMAPSPTAEATRLIDPLRTSPTANIPGAVVSRISGVRPSSPNDALAALAASVPVSTYPPES